MLEDFKILIENCNEEKAKLYIKRAENSIRAFCNLNENDVLNSILCDAVVQLAVYSYRSEGTENITQMSQGSRSITYKNIGGSYQNSLPSEIEVMCKPYRKVRCLGNVL